MSWVANGGSGERGGTTAGRGCPDAPRVRLAVRHLLSEENSSSPSSSLPSLSSELKALLARCASCAAEARALDPTLLFVPLEASLAAAPAAEEVRRVVDDVLADVRRRSRVAAPPARGPFFSRRFLQAAALVVLAAGLFSVGGIRLARREPAPAGLAPTPSKTQDGQDAREALDVRPPVRPLIQDLKNPGARVYEFAAVSPKEPNVVFIADPHADL
ncbi:MAG TPA: hypothetical protein VLJ18_07485 [Thermoanaerobaculia bacterium]|nr:hypothetical protein [Thermoanaerobaculia bacterium]